MKICETARCFAFSWYYWGNLRLVLAAAWGRTLRANRDTKEDFVLVTEWLSRVATDCCLNGRRNWRDVCSIAESSNPKIRCDFSEAEFPVGILLWGTSPLRRPANITFYASSTENDTARFELSTTACKTLSGGPGSSLPARPGLPDWALAFVRSASLARAKQVPLHHWDKSSLAGGLPLIFLSWVSTGSPAWD